MNLKEGKSGIWKGIIKRIIYAGQNNFAIVCADIEKVGEVTVSGQFLQAQKDIPIIIEGKVVMNKKYNSLQINATNITIDMAEDYVTAYRFLSSGLIPGFGNKTADLAIKMYGTDLAKYMTDVDKLTAIKGISSRKAKRIVKAFDEERELLEIYATVKGNLTINQAEKIHEKYGKDAAIILKKNPYKLIYDIDNFGFVTADTLALKIGYDLLGEERLGAATVYALNKAETENGHTYLPTQEAIESAQLLIYGLKELKQIYYRKVLGLNVVPDDTTEWDESILGQMIKEHPQKVNNLITKLENSRNEEEPKLSKDFENITFEEKETLNYYIEEAANIAKLIEKTINKKSKQYTQNKLPQSFEIGETPFITIVKNNGEKLLFSQKNYETEKALSEIITDMIHKKPLKEISVDKIKKAISNTEMTYGITLDEDQKEAVENTIKSRLSVITGGPGRGKTTIIKMIIECWDDDANVVLLAPTGKAARRMREATGHEASTIHRFLLTNKEGIINNKTLLIVDETSMLDIYLAKWLLSKTSNAQICFVGDVDQLPSVGAGTFLKDLIESGQVPCTRLESCHRNAGSIFFNSTIIKKGLPLQELAIDTHFRTLWLPDAESTLKNVLSAYQKQLENYRAEDIIILTPMRKNLTGVNNLNLKIQEMVNPPAADKKEIVVGYGNDVKRIREGDRVIQEKNNYNISIEEDGNFGFGVFNGDTGTITEIDTEEEIITITFDDGKIGYYAYIDAGNLNLAYALTYHKSQGSEYKVVICILTNADYLLLQRKILYTGESRAKDKCFFIGQAKAFSMAMSDTISKNGRNTYLSELILQVTKNVA